MTSGRSSDPGQEPTLGAADVAGLAQALTSVAAVPANEDVLRAALGLVAALARATVGGADGVSVTMRRHERFVTLASSDETVLDMDHDQYSTGEGPCLDAATQGRRFHVASLVEEDRWPAFTPRAAERGIRSILSTPILAPTRPVGALNIYSHTPQAFASGEQELAALFATQASAIVTSALVDVPAPEVATRLHAALQIREVVAQAQGVLMAREGLTAEGAHAHLRRLARRSSVPLRLAAEREVASTRREAGTDPDPPTG